MEKIFQFLPVAPKILRIKQLYVMKFAKLIGNLVENNEKRRKKVDSEIGSN